MNEYVVIVVCGLGAVLFASLRHAYFYAPGYELKRRATRDNQLLKKLIKVSMYEHATKLLLGLLTYVLVVSTVIATSYAVPFINAFVLITLFLGLVVYASRYNSRLAVRFASWLAQYLEPVVRKLDPFLQTIRKRLNRKQITVTAIYEKEDLKNVIRVQKKAINNRITSQELDNALHALDFQTKKIRDYMVKHEDIHFVTAKEPIGPILINELHKSGFSCFPVQGNSKQEVVGMLHVSDLIAHTDEGVVGSVMDTKVQYVPEEQNLEYVLQAFTQTGKRLFVVLDAQEKIVGIISVGDVLEQILGHSIGTDFESYEDPSLVVHS